MHDIDPPVPNAERWAQADETGRDSAVDNLAQLDLNHATAPQLAAAADLEAETAASIVRHRTLHGHFWSWTDLQRALALDSAAMHRLRQVARIAGPTL
jgi:DNA uptake protein ComE-like DNA-binding protein